jgi:hypothetical protein
MLAARSYGRLKLRHDEPMYLRKLLIGLICLPLFARGGLTLTPASRLDDNVPVVVEKRVRVRWGSHVCQPRLMMKNEDAPHLFRASRRCTSQRSRRACAARRRRRGMAVFMATRDHLWMRPLLLWKQGGFVDRLGDLLSQEQASVVIETVVLSGIDAADARLLRRRRETDEVAFHSSQNL